MRPTIRPMIGSSQSGRTAPSQSAASPRAITTAPWPSAYSVPRRTASTWSGPNLAGRTAGIVDIGASVAVPGPVSCARISAAPP